MGINLSEKDKTTLKISKKKNDQTIDKRIETNG
jgi:hypothetical protein